MVLRPQVNFLNLQTVSTRRVALCALQKAGCDSASIEDTIRRHVPVASLVNDVSASPRSQ